MTLANFRSLARVIVPGAVASKITQTVLDLILNNGVRDIAAYTACLKTNKTFTITADDDDYDLSTVIGDYLVMDKPGLWWYDGTQWKQLYPRTLKWLDEKRPGWRDYDSDDPENYTIDGDILTLSPPPNTTLANGLKLYYGKAPTDMTIAGHYPFSGSTTELTHLSVFDDAILEYWRWKARLALNKGEDAYKMGESAYVRIREEKFNLFKRRPDISSNKNTRLQGRIVRA